MKKLLVVVILFCASFAFPQKVQKVIVDKPVVKSGIQKTLNSNFNASIIRGNSRRFDEVYIATYFTSYPFYTINIIQKPEFVDYQTNEVYNTSGSFFSRDYYTDFTLTAHNNAVPGSYLMKIAFNFGFSGTPDETDTLSINLIIYNDALQWDHVLAGTPTHFRSFAINGNNLFAGTMFSDDTGKVFLSTDKGLGWQLISNGLASPNTLWDINAIGFSDNSIFAGTSMGLYISSNNGSNWTKLNNIQGSVTSFAKIGVNLFAGTSYNGISLTTDNGQNWTRVNTGLIDQRVSTLAVMGSKLFAGTFSRVFLSNNNGQNWDTTEVLYQGANDIEALEVIDSSIFAACGASVYRSADNGGSWTSAGNGLLRRVTCLTARYSALFAGCDDGVYFSTNNGTSWSAVYNDSISSAIECIITDPEYLYVGTFNNGIWRLPLSSIIEIPVPVELISFNGYLDNDEVKLSWSTATEKNNYGFEIEKKIGISGWLNIGFVEGKGTTTNISHYQFSDEADLSFKGNIFYRLKQVDYDGSFVYSEVVSVHTGFPEKYSLSQNFPNPFNPSTTIKYQMPENGFVTLKIYDEIGNEVSTLVNEYKNAGSYDVTYNASNFASGIYFYTLKVNDFSSTKKLIFMK